MEKKSKVSFNSIGISLLLVVFLALCLVTFAVLSFVTARNNYKLSEKMADKTTAYYEANNDAEEVAGIIDGLLSEDKKVPESISLEDGSSVAIKTDGDVFSYKIDMADGMVLCVELQKDVVKNYKVIKWQSVSEAEWKGSGTLNVVN